MATVWTQATVTLPAAKRGCHLITNRIVSAVDTELKTLAVGLCHVFIQHTSASLTINENADPSVRADMETWLNTVVPEGRDAPWTHTDEGDDDMPAHVKAAVFGSSVTIPVRDGRLALGTWQGVYLAEHRDSGGCRSLVVTLHGQTKS
jgi:secondary thiamine-phosphate synthase enzyme